MGNTIAMALLLIACVHTQINLSSLVDHSSSECLNESDDHPFAHCLKPDSQFLESDCDEQLIIVLAFMQSVKLHTLQFVAPPDGRSTLICIHSLTAASWTSCCVYMDIMLYMYLLEVTKQQSCTSVKSKLVT